MSVSYIKQETRFILWGKASGRCQYEGCNKQLYLDSLTKAELNSSYVAHIIADSPNGPRGHETLSEELKEDINNLMLMCDEHHRLIDRKQVDEHPVDRLQKMKKEHEKRMIHLTNILERKEAHVILYGANIGAHNSPVIYQDICTALAPDYYPSNVGGIELGLKNSSFTDDNQTYWRVEEENLKSKFNQKVIPLKESSNIQNYCVFGVAPQPLLIKLGTLLYDLNNVEVYNNQKEPKTWKWNEGEGNEDYFRVIRPNTIKSNIALVFSLSATITDERIVNVLREDTSIWKITLDSPNNDFLKHKNHLSQFRNICRKVLDEIKSQHGESNVINIFPAMLPSTAIELGRVWYPKADLPLIIYDQNKNLGGFIKALEIKN